MCFAFQVCALETVIRLGYTAGGWCDSANTVSGKLGSWESEGPQNSGGFVVLAGLESCLGHTSVQPFGCLPVPSLLSL